VTVAAATFVAGGVLGLVVGLNVGAGGEGPRAGDPRDGGPQARESVQPAPETVGPTETYPEDEVLEPVAPAPGVSKPDGKREKPAPKEEPIPLYVVIDDVGNSLEQLAPFLSLDIPITFAVLPQRPHSNQAVRRIEAAGQEAILHLPMEAENGTDPGAGAILTNLDAPEIEKRIAANLQSVPGVVGVNNHMGSKATADEKTMDAVLRYLKGHDLFFLDSRTTARTVGKALAEKHQVSFAERHVFLDNEPNRDYIRQAVEQGMDIARQRGHAVLIGHVMVTEVAQVLEEMYPFIQDEGFDLHHLSDLVLGPQDDDMWN
jgi:polysaccharide deacetylase 2 family uncharacterized protein YibQ